MKRADLPANERLRSDPADPIIKKKIAVER